ncbi:MAG TPA: hypothetical protein VMY35_13395 [Phycisphaerae bacterium]|nr:hypothetical protein [Phycisphaerae bacterium]
MARKRKRKVTLAELKRRAEAAAAEAAGGLVCRRCGCRDFRVTHTWRRKGSIKRRRECRLCGLPKITYESEGENAD